MAYLQHVRWTDRPGAVAGVIAIHGLLVYALVTGLDVTKIVDQAPRLGGYEVKVPLDPPPPPPPEPAADPEPKLAAPPIHAPAPPLDVSREHPVFDTTALANSAPELIAKVAPTPIPGPSARQAFDPVSAKPRNDPGDWVTEADYRSSWINREMSGTARFRLEIAGSGKVEGCTITGSSGHPDLDKATCDLVTRRAKFDPAKDSAGTRTDGSYASSVRWQIPD